MTSVNIFIEPHLSCSKLSYSLREDRLPQAINLVYKFFNPFISNGDLIVALISFSRSKHAVTFKNSYYIGSAEGHEYPNLQVGDEVNPRPIFIFS